MQHVAPLKAEQPGKADPQDTCPHKHCAQFCPQQGQKFNDSSQQVRGAALTVQSGYSCTCQ